MNTSFLYVRDGIAKVQEKKYEEAEICFKRAIQHDEEKPDGYRELGDLYFKMGRYDEALKIYDEYLEYRETTPFAYFGKSKCFHKLGKYKEEEHCLNKLYLITTSYPGYEHAYAKNLMATNNLRTAIMVLDDAIHHNPKDTELLRLRIELYNRTKEKEKEFADLSTLINIEYKDFRNYVKYGKLALELKKFEEAERAVRQALKLSDNDEVVVELYEKIPAEYKRDV